VAIASIYEALTDDEAFRRLPEVLAGAVGARSAILQTFDENQRLTSANFNYFSPEMGGFYVENEIYTLDPWRAPCTALSVTKGFVNATEVIGIENYLGGVFYNEFMRPFGDDTAHCLGSFIALNGQELCVGIHRGLRDRTFTEEDIATTTAMGPHLRRLFDTRALLSLDRVGGGLTEAALNVQERPVAITDSLGKPLYMNAAAVRAFRSEVGLSLRRGRLSSATEPDAERLAAAIKRACNTYVGSTIGVRGAGDTFVRVGVAPLCAAGRTYALITMDDPSEADCHLQRKLMEVYGLTRAEAEVASLLAQSVSTAHIATRRKVSIATIRTQIRQMLEKMEARNLFELGMLLRSIPPGSVGP
jgi:DNA-binding CsgD family transcriptional regulator